MVKLSAFLKFVKERESIRIKRAGGSPAPWTKDRILQRFRFCNIRRSDDRVSRWLIHNVLNNRWAVDDLGNFLEISAWCRWINWPPTIQKVIDAGLLGEDSINWSKVGKFVDRIEGKKWTGAYMITAPRKAKEKKGQFVAKHIIQGSLRPIIPRLIQEFDSGSASCQSIWKLLQEQDYFGSFMAGQVVGDWGYTPLLANAPDRMTWAPMGPGSKRGFNRIMQRPIKTKISPEEWEENLLKWGNVVRSKLGPNYADLTALDLQNIFCEWDKYARVKNGEGRPRAKYHSHSIYYDAT